MWTPVSPNCKSSRIAQCHGMEWNGMEWNGMEWNGMEDLSVVVMLRYLV